MTPMEFHKTYAAQTYLEILPLYPFFVHRFAPHCEGIPRSAVKKQQPAQAAQTAFGYSAEFFPVYLTVVGQSSGRIAVQSLDL